MNQRQTTNQSFVCSCAFRCSSAEPRKCPKCGMDLAGGHALRFAPITMSRPMHLAIMAVVMLLVMTALMMAMR